MDAFSHISNNIDKIYKQLTKSNTHPLGGTAYLYLENEDDPFLHGIKYTAMPPAKRFRDMEQLSGGEKTVAALALLFSIHRYALEERNFFFSSMLQDTLAHMPCKLVFTTCTNNKTYITDRILCILNGTFQDVEMACTRCYTFIICVVELGVSDPICKFL